MVSVSKGYRAPTCSTRLPTSLIPVVKQKARLRKALLVFFIPLKPFITEELILYYCFKIVFCKLFAALRTDNIYTPFARNDCRLIV